MALLTTAELLAHVSSDLATASLQRLLDDSESDIIKFFGPHSASSSQVETLIGEGRSIVFVTKSVSAVNSIVETIGRTSTTLSADDYEVHSNLTLERLDNGTNARSAWGDRVKVTYTPKSETDQRKRVQIDLCKLAINFEGLSSESSGNYSRSFGDYQLERQRILSNLRHGFSFVQ